MATSKMVIRIFDHGKGKHPFWWIILQPYNRGFRGRINEKLGICCPRQLATIDRSIVVNRPRIAHWLGVISLSILEWSTCNRCCKKNV